MFTQAFFGDKLYLNEIHNNTKSRIGSRHRATPLPVLAASMAEFNVSKLALPVIPQRISSTESIALLPFA